MFTFTKTSLYSLLRNVALATCLALTAVSAHALSRGYYTTASHLKQGNWVKVRATTEGIQQITYDQLRQWGFADPTAVRVYGYGGTALFEAKFTTDNADDLPVTPSIHTNDGRLLFYADTDVRLQVTGSNTTVEADVRRNPYATAGYYLLSDVNTGADDPQPVPAPTDVDAQNAQNWHLATQLLEDEVQNKGMGSSVFHGYLQKPGDLVPLRFSITDYCPNTDVVPGAHVNVKIAAANRTYSNSYQPTLEMPVDGITYINSQPTAKINPVTSSTIYAVGNAWATFKGADDDAIVPDSDYSFRVSFPAFAASVESGFQPWAAIDYAYLVYPRYNRIKTGASEAILNCVNTADGAPFAILGATEQTRVWNVTNPSRVYEHQGVYDAAAGTYTASYDGTYSLTQPSGRKTMRLVAFNIDDAHHNVEFAGNVAPQNLHGLETPELLIITTDELLPYAEELAQAHRTHDGISVVTVTQQQVFNEFSSGTPSVMAYRRLAKMFHDRDPQTFKYLLLYGAASYDNRHLEITPPNERLLIYEIEPLLVATQTEDREYRCRQANLNFGSDLALGMLADNYDPDKILATLPDIAVGRIPAEHAGNAVDVNSKLLSYIANPPSVSTYLRALMLSDDGDANGHLRQSEAQIKELQKYQPAITAIRAHNSLYPRGTGLTGDAVEARKLIIRSLKDGAGLFCYSGHGRATGFTAEELWSQKYVQSTQYDVPPVAMIASCDTYNVDRPVTAISQTMLLEPRGGMIGVIGACRSVFMADNQNLALAVCRAYAKLNGNSTLGDLYKTAHSYVINSSTSSRLRRNTFCYNLCGDPAIRLSAPAQTAQVTAVNGNAVAANDTVEVNPLNRVTLNGRINQPTGSTIDATFNGQATLTLYDASRIMPVIIKNPDKNPQDSLSNPDQKENILVDQTPLATVSVPVNAGEFTASMMVPYNVFIPSSEAVNRLIISAVTSDGKRAATGILNALRVDGAAADGQALPGDGPQITEMYINNPDFIDGDRVSGPTTLYATLQLGEGGINVSEAIGAATRVILDGARSITDADKGMTVNADGTASFRLPLSGLANGRHSVMLSVSDNAGNHSSQSLTFNLAPANVKATLTADETVGRNTLTFDLTHDYPAEGQAPSAHLLVLNSAGNTVLSVPNASMPYTWDLNDNNGQPVTDGFYRAAVLLNNGSVQSSTPFVNVTVLH